jgi:hypothetical protein
MDHSKERNKTAWTFWYEQQTDKLYQCTRERISQHPRMWYNFDEEGITIYDLPLSVIPVDVERMEHAWRLRTYYNGPQIEIRTIEEKDHTVNQTIMKLQKWEQELLEVVTIQVQEDIMKQEVTKPMKIASDGSV